MQRLRNEAASQEGREALLTQTGIRDDVLLDELSQLGITVDGMMALRLFPLVLVAWAGRDADIDERHVVMNEAVRLGICEGTSAWVLLDQWLVQRPPGLGVDAWKRSLHQSFDGLSGVTRRRLIDLTEHQMTAVAKASGGHLGFGKVSKVEQSIIDQVLTAMRQELVI